MENEKWKIFGLSPGLIVVHQKRGQAGNACPTY